MRSIPARLWLLVLLSVCLQLLPFPLAGPVPVWRRAVCWVCLVPLLLALQGRNSAGHRLSLLQATCLGYVCGCGWFFGNCYWVYQTMYLYGGIPAPASFGILVLFSLYLGIYLGLFGLGYAALERSVGARAALAFSPVLWVAVELARSRVTGFPWDLLGYTQIDNHFLVPLVHLTGVMGLSLVVAAGNALWLWQPARGSRWPGPVLAGVLVCLSIAGSLYQPPADPATASAVLLQDNLHVGQEAVGPREPEPVLLRDFARLTSHPQVALPQGLRDLPPELLAWPEAPTPFADADPELRATLGSMARAEHAPLVVQTEGAGTTPNENGRSDQFVSASFYLPDGSYAGRYDKMHLVPFGEYTPYKKLFFFAGQLLDQLILVPGTRRRVFSVNGHRYGAFICYESIFGDEIREFTEKGADVLVNLSDDGWYGDTSAPWEHLDMARMRAIENDRWLLRDTNTGLTASIDPEGRVVAALPRHVRDAIRVPFGYRTRLTFYTQHGDWIGWLCAIVCVSLWVGSALQRRFPVQRKVN